MKIGVVSRSFPEMTNAQCAQYMKENGFGPTELCLTAADSKYWAYNGRSDISDMTDERFADIVKTYRDTGIEVAALGVFTNMIAHEEDVLRANIEFFKAHIRWAGQNGIPFVSTECGFNTDHRGINASVYESDFALLKKTLCELLEECEKWDVCLALETCVLDIVPSAKRARDLIAQIGSPRLKLLLDPANLIANSSEEDMFAYCAEHIGYFHGKDRHVNDTYGRCVGDGEIDWVKFMKLYHEHCEGRPMILEYVKKDNVCMIRDRLAEFDRQAQEQA